MDHVLAKGAAAAAAAISLGVCLGSLMKIGRKYWVVVWDSGIALRTRVPTDGWTERLPPSTPSLFTHSVCRFAVIADEGLPPQCQRHF